MAQKTGVNFNWIPEVASLVSNYSVLFTYFLRESLFTIPVSYRYSGDVHRSHKAGIAFKFANSVTCTCTDGFLIQRDRVNTCNEI
ncbi:hypothetical protein DPMN_145827 [Dreissena polymorpha]|uniref:Uncharacterized protein n=1 Tax=Dreissena polymorpha TaxID=45954 RepID=A0A9D4J1J7_DREPO|nr:hypothetical protein DPMN_145827 [Dreissena polymorpha]